MPTNKQTLTRDIVDNNSDWGVSYVAGDETAESLLTSCVP